MPLTLAIASPKKFNKLFCKRGDVSKTVWLDDAGRKRDIEEYDLDVLSREAVPTSPKENLTPDVLSALRYPDWVEDKIKEAKRREAAVNQYYEIEALEVNAEYAAEEAMIAEYDLDGDDDVDDEKAAIAPYEDDEKAIAEYQDLLEANEDIEV
jgi:hypothetical protein